MKYRIVFQDRATDCGYASFAMILKYYGIKYDENELKKRLKISKDGTSAYNIIMASKYYGLKAQGYKIDINNLYNQQLPLILHTIKNDLQHFVVLYNIDKTNNIITLVDPSSGLIKLSITDFLNIWTGIILVFKYNNIIKRPKEIDNKILSKIIKSEKYNIVIITFFSFITSILNIIFSLLISIVLWNIINNINTNNLIILILLIGILKDLFSYIRNRLVLKFNHRFSSNLTEVTINHLLSLPHKFYQKYYSGEIVSRIKDLSFITNIISKFSLTIFIDLLLLIIIYILIVIYNIYIAVLVSVISLLFILVIKIYSKYFKTKTHLMHIKSEVFFSKLVDIIENINTIKNLNIEKYINNNITNIKNDMYSESLVLNNKYNSQYIIKSIINLCFSVVFIILSIKLIDLNIMKLSSLLIINTFVNLFLDLLINILDLEQDYQEANSSYRRLKEIYGEKEEDNNGIIIKSVDDIKFVDTSYSYDGKNKVLDSINFNIKNGEKILITGHSGSGKSTLFKLLNKQLSNSKIYINDIRIDKISSSCIRRLITYVDQNERLFTESINTNLVLDNKLDQNVIDILNINNIINKNNVLQDASNLSGGEKSKIIIGRALMCSNNVIIFDETTSQIDIKGEKEILKNIFNSYPNKIFIIISHRLVNKDIFDRIVYFENGKIKEVVNNA